MRHGVRVIDSDTHVNPSLDTLLRYADGDLRQRLDDLQPYRRTVPTVRGRGDADESETSTILSVKPVRLQRVAGEKAAAACRPHTATYLSAPRVGPMSRERGAHSRGTAIS